MSDSQSQRIKLEVTIDRDRFEDLIKCCKIEGGAVEKVASDILVVGIRTHLDQQRRSNDAFRDNHLNMAASMNRLAAMNYKS